MPKLVNSDKFLDNRQISICGGGYKGIIMKIQFRHSFEKLISIENILNAWKEFVKGKRNKKDVQEFQFNLMENIISLHNDLKNREYKHGGYREFNICDPKPRRISKAN